MKGVQTLKQASPTILTCMGAVGVIFTAVSAVKATPKALEQIKHDSRMNHDGDPYGYTKFEAVKSAWKYYIPTVAIGASTIACIFGANVLNKRQQAALASAYMLLENTYKEYRNKVKDSFGEDTDILVRDEIVKDKYEASNDILDEDCLFYEFNYGKFFNRSRQEVLHAEYKFNKKFARDGYVNLNHFYKLLDLPTIEAGEAIGWKYDDRCGYPWIDFEHELLALEDGMECFVINIPEPPSIDYPFD